MPKQIATPPVNPVDPGISGYWEGRPNLQGYPDDIRSVCFPRDLLASPNQYGGNAMVFLIRERKRGTVSGSGANTTITTGGFAPVKYAVALPIPANLTFNHAVDYDVISSDISKLTGNQAGAGAFNSLSTKSDFKQMLKDSSGNLKGSGIAKLLTSLGAQQEDALLRAGYAVNPHNEQSFKGLPFRTFQWDFELLPKNKDDALSAHDIANLFRYNMLPKYSEDVGGSVGKAFFVYPNVFQVEFLKNGVVNPWIPGVKELVLTNMSYLLCEQGFSSDNEGVPTQIKLSLQFTEITLCTATDVRKRGQ